MCVEKAWLFWNLQLILNLKKLNHSKVEFNYYFQIFFSPMWNETKFMVARYGTLRFCKRNHLIELVAFPTLQRYQFSSHYVIHWCFSYITYKQVIDFAVFGASFIITEWRFHRCSSWHKIQVPISQLAQNISNNFQRLFLWNARINAHIQHAMYI